MKKATIICDDDFCPQFTIDLIDCVLEDETDEETVEQFTQARNLLQSVKRQLDGTLSIKVS